MGLTWGQNKASVSPHSPQGCIQHSHLHPTHTGDSRAPPSKMMPLKGRRQCLGMSWVKWKKLPSVVFGNLPGHVRRSKCKVCHPPLLLLSCCIPSPKGAGVHTSARQDLPLFPTLPTHGLVIWAGSVGTRQTLVCQGHRSSVRTSSCPSLNFQTAVFI